MLFVKPKTHARKNNITENAALTLYVHPAQNVRRQPLKFYTKTHIYIYDIREQPKKHVFPGTSKGGDYTMCT